jgi:hypothetical protein
VDRQRLVALVGVLTAIQLGLFAWYLNANIIRHLYWDMYSWVLHYLDYRAQGGWWAYVWGSHDVHRPVFIRLLTAFDIEAFSGASYPFIVFTTACHVGTGWLLWRECQNGAHDCFGRALGRLVLMLVFTSVAAVACAVPLNNGYLHVLTCAVAAIVLFDGAGEDRGGGRFSAHWRRTGAVLAAIAAPFASAVGWAVWPILFWIAWRGRAGRAWIAAIAVVATAFVPVYLQGLSIEQAAGPSPARALDSLDSAIGRLNYLVTYLGLPWTRADALSVPGRICGAMLLGAGALAVLARGVLRAPSGRLERIGLALIMFSLGTALLASIGRVDLVPDDGVLVPVRYSSLVAPLYVGLLWIVSPVLQRVWNDVARSRIVAAGVVGVCVLLLVQQVGVGQAATAITSRMRTTIEQFEAGNTSPEMRDVVFSDLDQARREWEIIRRAGLYTNVD